MSSVVIGRHLVDLIMSLLQSLLLLLIKFGNDGRDLRLVTQNDLALLRQIIVLRTSTDGHSESTSYQLLEITHSLTITVRKIFFGHFPNFRSDNSMTVAG